MKHPATQATGDAPTYSIDELSRATGISVRNIRHYIRRGLLARPRFRGVQTRYSQEHLIRLRAIARMGKRRRVEWIAARLAAASPDELLRLAGMEPPPPPPAPEPPPPPPPEPALAPPPPPAPAVLHELPDPSFIGPYRPALAVASERCEHIAICPGVELVVRTGADAEAWRVASEIVRLFASRAPGA